jgi:hypothetical protein
MEVAEHPLLSHSLIPCKRPAMFAPVATSNGQSASSFCVIIRSNHMPLDITSHSRLRLRREWRRQLCSASLKENFFLSGESNPGTGGGEDDKKSYRRGESNPGLVQIARWQAPMNTTSPQRSDNIESNVSIYIPQQKRLPLRNSLRLPRSEALTQGKHLTQNESSLLRD